MLLAEDNMGDVHLVREALSLDGLDVELTYHRDGEQVERYIDDIDAGKTPCPDVVLLDLNLPKRDGAALLARLRDSGTCRSIPVIIVTSSNSQRDRDITSRLGATRYFCKPADFDAFMRLGALVREVVDGYVS